MYRLSRLRSEDMKTGLLRLEKDDIEVFFNHSCSRLRITPSIPSFLHACQCRFSDLHQQLSQAVRGECLVETVALISHSISQGDALLVLPCGVEEAVQKGDHPWDQQSSQGNKLSIALLISWLSFHLHRHVLLSLLLNQPAAREGQHSSDPLLSLSTLNNLATSPPLPPPLVNLLPLLVRHLLGEACPLCQHWSHRLAFVEVGEPVVESFNGCEVDLKGEVFSDCSSRQYATFCSSPFFRS